MTARIAASWTLVGVPLAYGLFETIRRHVAFEREHILPVVREAA